MELTTLGEVEVHGGPRNFAVKKSAYQSSTWNYTQTADKAVDGNTDVSNPDSSMTCSKTDIRMDTHTWEIDIGFLFIVNHVVIYERSDGVDELSGFQVFIGNHSNPWNINKSLQKEQLGQFRYRCIADNSVARFVSVIRQNKNTMTLCEVEVYGECLDGTYSEFCNRTCGQCSNREPCNKDTGECLRGCEPGWTGILCDKGHRNFALKKSAYQSSTSNYKTFNWTADKAVDGNIDGSNPYTSRTCSRTSSLIGNQTWEVDIGFMFIVNLVVIYRRSDGWNDVSGIQVFIGNHSNPWNTNKPLKNENLDKFRYLCIADNSLARFVSVIRQNKTIMTLCEVEVYGECLDGTYSEFCNRTCGQCSNREPCEKDTGECLHGCEPGWTGILCDKECARGTYGSGCTYTCGQCLNGNETCSATDGHCSMGCREGWQGETCKNSLRNLAVNKSAYQSSTWNYTQTADKAVDGNTDGINSDSSMTCSKTDIRMDTHTWEIDIGFLFIVNHVVIYERSDGVDELSGFQVFIGNHSNPWNTNKSLQKEQLGQFRYRCIADNSVARFVSVIRQNKNTMTLCEVEVYGECLDGMYSEFCNRTCGQCSNRESCNKDTGECLRGCEPGWTGILCDKECLDGTYSEFCNRTCGQCSNREPCEKDTGECLRGCEPGWTGILCDKECARGTYGSGCTYTCGQCLNGNDTCSATDGRCSMGCREGWQGETCKTNSSATLTHKLTREDMAVICGSVVGVCVGALIISIIIFVVLKKGRNTDTGDPEMEMNETGVRREESFGDTAVQEIMSPSDYNGASLCIPTTTASRDDSEHAVTQIIEAEYENLQDRRRIESSLYSRINGTETEDTNYYDEVGLHIGQA